jgi:uncharacterized membrane protein YeaQ/YmgE (transglycosylase-associated protein family)
MVVFVDSERSPEERRSAPSRAADRTHAPVMRCRPAYSKGWAIMGILWTIIIGFIAGVIAKFLSPGPNNPGGFILTTILGIVGAFVATWLGQALGWYRAGEGAGLIGAIVGALIVLFIWHMVAGRRATDTTYR